MSGSVISIPIPKKGIGCQQLLNIDGVVHHGVLRKRTMVNKLTDSVVKSIVSNPSQLIQWPRRYVVLHEGCVYMYKEETSSKAAYAVSLYGYNSVLPCSGEVQGKLPWPFKVVHALNSKELTLYFSAPTEKDMSIWLELITQQLIFANGFNAAGTLPRLATGTTSLPQNVPTVSGGYNLSTGWSSSASSSSGGSVSDLRGPHLATAGGLGESELVYMTDDEDDDDGEFENDYDHIEEHGISKPLTQLSLDSPSLVHGGSGSGTFATGAPNRPPMPVKPPRSLPQQQPPPVAAKPGGEKTKPVVAAKPGNVCGPGVTNKEKTAAGANSNSGHVYYGQDSTPCLYASQFSQAESIDDPDYNGGGEYLDMEIKQEVKQPEKGIENAYWRRAPEEADRTMKTISLVGAYMIRASQDPGSQTLLVKGENIVRKYKIRCGKDGKYSIAATAPGFDTITALIVYYKINALPQTSDCLTRPYSTVWKDQ